MSGVEEAVGSDPKYEALISRAETLERKLHETEIRMITSVREFDLKAEALRAGIVDLDGLRLLDPTVISNPDDGDFDAAAIVVRLRREKPWLFGVAGSSSGGSAPPAVAVKKRLATDMSVEEWRAARADLLRRR